MHFIKGLEFKVVIIAGLNSKVMPLCPVRNEEEDMDMVESREEKIRQWVLRELRDTYGYPTNLFTVEQKVNIGSQIKFADIAVDIYRNNTKGPYILIEVKSWGSGIKGALSQLKSYMANTPTAKYWIVTVGNEIVIINKIFKLV